MKKLILVFAFSLLSITSLFGGWKDKFKAGLDKGFDKFERFVDKNLNSEKIEKTRNTIKEFFEKSDCKPQKEHNLKNIQKTEQHMPYLEFFGIVTIIEKFEEMIKIIEDDAGSYMPHTYVLELKKSANNAKAHVNYFIETYPTVLTHLQTLPNDADVFYSSKELKASTKPESFKITESEYNHMCDNFDLFTTSCMYLSLLEEIVLKDIALHGKTYHPESMDEKFTMLKKLDNLMKDQSATINKKVKASGGSSL